MKQVIKKNGGPAPWWNRYSCGYSSFTTDRGIKNSDWGTVKEKAWIGFTFAIWELRVKATNLIYCMPLPLLGGPLLNWFILLGDGALILSIIVSGMWNPSLSTLNSSRSTVVEAKQENRHRSSYNFAFWTWFGFFEYSCMPTLWNRVVLFLFIYTLFTIFFFIALLVLYYVAHSFFYIFLKLYCTTRVFLWKKTDSNECNELCLF